MAKVTISNITSGYASTTALNTAFGTLEEELNNKVLYRNNPTGEPNQMENDIDMNGHSLLNLASLEVAGVDFATVLTTAEAAADQAAASELVATAAALSASNSASEAEDSAAIVADWSFEGAWTTTTAYKVNNIVTEAGNTYICLIDHTSGTFSTDLSNLKWQILAEKGAAGAGTGDMLGSNNLSDVTDVATARGNLGLGSIATQAANNVSISGGSIAGIADLAVADGGTGASTLTANNVILGNGTSPVQFVAPGTSGNVLKSNGTTWTSAASGPTLMTPYTITGSETQIDFTDIPSGVKRVTIILHNVSLNAATYPRIRLGTSSGVSSTSYYSASSTLASGTSTTNSTTSFILYDNSANATDAWYGTVTFTLLDSSTDIWVASGVLGTSNTAQTITVVGSKDLVGPLTTVRLDGNFATFDSGIVNVLYE